MLYSCSSVSAITWIFSATKFIINFFNWTENKQNNRYYAIKYRRNIHEESLHNQRITIQCAVCAKKITTVLAKVSHYQVKILNFWMGMGDFETKDYFKKNRSMKSSIYCHKWLQISKHGDFADYPIFRFNGPWHVFVKISNQHFILLNWSSQYLSKTKFGTKKSSVGRYVGKSSRKCRKTGLLSCGTGYSEYFYLKK